MCVFQMVCVSVCACVCGFSLVKDCGPLKDLMSVDVKMLPSVSPTVWRRERRRGKERERGNEGKGGRAIEGERETGKV